MTIWTASPPVPQLAAPAPQAPTPRPPELTRLASALDAIPNINGHELDYDRWRDVVFAIHYATDGSDDGLALAQSFSARSAKHDAEFLDTRVWPYIRSERGGAVITDRTVYAQASQHGWVDPDVLGDFDVIPDEPPAPSAGRYAFKAAHEFTAGKPAVWMVKGVIPQADLVVLYGASGAGKSFLALDLAVAVAQGNAWRGLRTQQHRVAYIAAEGAGGFRNRLKAQAHQHQIDLTQLDLAVLADAPNFAEKKDITDLIHAMKASGQFGLVIVDTLAQVTPGANENSGEDMGRVISHCRAIHKQTGATVLLIHHSGKDEGKGARGWSGLRAAADAELEVSRSDHDRLLTVTKQKDGEDGQGFGFKLLTVPVGMDEDGEVITSCVVEHGAHQAKANKLGRLGDMQRRVLEVVLDLQTLGGEGARHEDVLNATADQKHDRVTAKDRHADEKRNASRALKALLASNRLVQRGGLYCPPSREDDATPAA